MANECFIQKLAAGLCNTTRVWPCGKTYGGPQIDGQCSANICQFVFAMFHQMSPFLSIWGPLEYVFPACVVLKKQSCTAWVVMKNFNFDFVSCDRGTWNDTGLDDWNQLCRLRKDSTVIWFMRLHR